MVCKRIIKGGKKSLCKLNPDSIEPNQSQNLVAPLQSYGLVDGATSQRDSALIAVENMNTNQANMTSTHGGKRKQRKHTRRIKRVRRGGSGCVRAKTAAVNVIPQFPNTGPIAGPVDANSSSIAGNTTKSNAIVQATNDCYATGTCNIASSTASGTAGGTAGSTSKWHSRWHSKWHSRWHDKWHSKWHSKRRSKT